MLQRFLPWQLRNETVEPFGKTGQQVFARISALLDSLNGAQVWRHSRALVMSSGRACLMMSSMISKA